MNTLPKLPIGDSSFESIRGNNLLYIDKTRYIYKMADEGKYYFMSRPRRFGKSLTVSTLRCFFQGKKEMFQGLWLGQNTQWEWKEHPLIFLDFNGISHDTPENLKKSLQRTLEKISEAYDVICDAPLLKHQFKELILSLHKKNGMPVVILIDEYDKPLIDHLGKGREAMETAKANRDILKHFLGVIKDGDVAAVLRFVFITGVSKFSRVSVFSELNNLNDITMNRYYAEMLGYTQSEIENCFKSHIKGFAEEYDCASEQIIEQLKIYYNGYRFSERDVRVYNPFSVLKSLAECAFKNYWFETGTPTFLINLLRERNYPLPTIENMEAGEETFSTYEIENLKPEALLFQTGYVTIKDVEDHIYTFTYPNKEVKLAFQKHLLFSYLDKTVNYSKILRISSYLQKGMLNDFMEAMSAVFASIPYSIESKRDEAYFHTVFYLAVSGYGVHADSEVLSSEGRIDLVMEFPDRVYVIEFKCDRSADKALRQIHEKNYAQKYQDMGKKIILMGINFDSQKRNISEWKQESYENLMIYRRSENKK
ncbi:MAG: AAA family ATPase [Desulfococcaceae bacterium]|jgi:hypothetical protein|nr:AAA family ATPase [Desulfococcaceae bacterium]